MESCAKQAQRERKQVSWYNDHAGPGPHGRAAELLWWPHSSASPEETWKSWEQSGGRDRRESSGHHRQLAMPGSVVGIASTSCRQSMRVNKGRGTIVPRSPEPWQPPKAPSSPTQLTLASRGPFLCCCSLKLLPCFADVEKLYRS